MQAAMMGNIEAFYSALGRLIRLHRLRLDLTQERLGQLAGLSRTSITNIENGRQHILTHQMFIFANVLKVPPEALLPGGDSPVSQSDLAAKLPAGTEEDIAKWVENIIRE